MLGSQSKKILPGVLAMHDAVFDTGPLIHLHEIAQLKIIISIFKTIQIPEQVVREITNDPIISFIQQHSEKIIIHPISEPDLFATKDAYSNFRLHLADLAVLILLNINTDAFAATDDLALRRAVESTGRTVVGTIGLLFRAKTLQLIDKIQLSQLINQVFDDSTLYLNSAFKNRVLVVVDSID